jgi:hypothetical protein
MEKALHNAPLNQHASIVQRPFIIKRAGRHPARIESVIYDRHAGGENGLPRAAHQHGFPFLHVIGHKGRRQHLQDVRAYPGGQYGRYLHALKRTSPEHIDSPLGCGSTDGTHVKLIEKGGKPIIPSDFSILSLFSDDKNAPRHEGLLVREPKARMIADGYGARGLAVGRFANLLDAGIR